MSSSPAGINCGSDCSESYPANAVVTLTATPAGGARFGGWSGACTGLSTTCQVSMNAARSVTARFTATVHLTVIVSNSIHVNLFSSFGSNRIQAVGLSCQQTGSGQHSCTADVPAGIPLAVTAVPDPGDSFDHWSGSACDASTAPSCTFTPQVAAFLTGMFADA